MLPPKTRGQRTDESERRRSAPLVGDHDGVARDDLDDAPLKLVHSGAVVWRDVVLPAARAERDGGKGEKGAREGARGGRGGEGGRRAHAQPLLLRATLGGAELRRVVCELGGPVDDARQPQLHQLEADVPRRVEHGAERGARLVDALQHDLHRAVEQPRLDEEARLRRESGVGAGGAAARRRAVRRGAATAGGRGGGGGAHLARKRLRLLDAVHKAHRRALDAREHHRDLLEAGGEHHADERAARHLLHHRVERLPLLRLDDVGDLEGARPLDVAHRRRRRRRPHAEALVLGGAREARGLGVVGAAALVLQLRPARRQLHVAERRAVLEPHRAELAGAARRGALDLERHALPHRALAEVLARRPRPRRVGRRPVPVAQPRRLEA